MAAALTPVRRELILGGQRSGKSRRGEALAAAWLAQSPTHRALLIATARAGDAEMEARIARHRSDRAQRLPTLDTVEAPLALAEVIRAHHAPQRLLLVDCLTLWLANWRMPLEAPPDAPAASDAADALLEALDDASGPVVLVANEIGLGVIPLGRETREFVDALGSLNQRVAAACDRVTLMAAGLPLALKEPSP